ncbi:MAG TPA: PLP-dependent aminotransferase family protein, partial [Pirellulales bacterium]|nr:PLP-dependent aminotransferase family protein [Pirellulales bacterium]
MFSATQLSCRAKRASGQPISRLMSLALNDPTLISLAAGFVDQQTLPVEITARAMEQVLSDATDARAALQYGTTMGNVRLREQVLDRLRQADGNPETERSLSVDQVILTAGSNQLLYLVADALLEPGDIVFCATPTYFVFLGILDNLSARPWGVASDAEGIIPKAIDDQMRALERRGDLGRVKAVYVTPYFDNPTGLTMSAERRAELLRVVERWSRNSRLYLIEDCAYRPLRYAGADVPSLRSLDSSGELVVLADTFSKSFSPGIRVGWGVLPPSLVEPVAGLKGNLDFGSAHLNQRLMSAVLDMGLLEEHVARLASGYQRKLSAMLAAADAFLSDIPGVRWRRP